MPGHSRLRSHESNQFATNVHRFNGADAQPRYPGFTQDLLQQAPKIDRVAKVAAVAAKVDAREDDFLVAVLFQLADLLDDLERLHAAALAPNLGNDAKRAAGVAAVLHLQRRTRAVIGKHRSEMESVADFAH